MQITVFGAGGIGGFMAAKLGSLLDTPDTPVHGVSLVAREAHLDAIKSGGLTFTGPDGVSRVVRPTAAAEDPTELPAPDLVLLCVKGYDLDAAVDSISPAIHAGTAVLPLLNGADIDERVRTRLPGTVVLPGCIYISAYIEAPGRVRHAAGPGKIVLGTSPDAPSWDPAPFLDACRAAEVPAEWRSDPAPAIWEKFLFIAPFSLVTAVSGEPIGGVLQNDSLREDVRAIIAETAELARRKEVALAEDVVEQTMDKAAGFAPETRTSFQRDIAAGSPRDERDVFAGTILRLGAAFGVATPATQRYTDALPQS